MPNEHSRRQFLNRLSLAGVAVVSSLAGACFSGGTRSLAADAPPEITTIRLEKAPFICLAPQDVVEGLLHAEGFIDVSYRAVDDTPTYAVAHNQLDWDLEYAPAIVGELDSGAPVTIVAGAHAGCQELIAHDHVRSILDLKGSRIGVAGTAPRQLISLMAKFVGLDPDRDLHWVDEPSDDLITLFADGRIDAILAGVPDILEIRASRIGHSIVSTTYDRPWS